MIMAAEKCVICLIGAMDRLWFHQIILFPNTKTSFPTAESRDYSSKNSSHNSSVLSEQQVSPLASVISAPLDESSSSQESYLDKETSHEERPSRLNLVSRKTRSQSSSLISARKKSRKLGRHSVYTYSTVRILQKTMSCKNLVELELEEVKGFMDLGFIFRKHNLSNRMMNLIPGLQRLDAYKNQENYTPESSEFDDDEEEIKGTMRPYLSEAWLVKRPDSPLLNLRMPIVSTSADMKNHLKYWARTVASAIQQES